MGRFYVTEMLLALTAKPSTQVAADELRPIRPGAWAAWTKSWGDQDAATAATSRVDDAAPTPSGAPSPLASSAQRG